MQFIIIVFKCLEMLTGLSSQLILSSGVTVDSFENFLTSL